MNYHPIFNTFHSWIVITLHSGTVITLHFWIANTVKIFFQIKLWWIQQYPLFEQNFCHNNLGCFVHDCKTATESNFSQKFPHNGNVMMTLQETKLWLLCFKLYTCQTRFILLKWFLGYLYLSEANIIEKFWFSCIVFIVEN